MQKYLVEVHTVDPDKPNDTYLFDSAEALREFVIGLAMDDGDYFHVTRDDKRTSI